MNFYVLDENQVQLGPFTAAELKEKGLLPEALVRTETSSDWVPASELSELKSIFNPEDSTVESSEGPAEEVVNEAPTEEASSSTEEATSASSEEPTINSGANEKDQDAEAKNDSIAIAPVVKEKNSSQQQHQRSRHSYQNIYEEYFDVNTLTEEERTKFSKHNFSDELGVGVCILLHFITCGFFTTIYSGLKYSNLPEIKQDDFGAGQAIGFMFIPFFNLYWIFIFWRTLAQRINFQFKLRGKAAPVSLGLATTYCILMFIPYLGWFVNALIIAPILLSQIQGASVILAEEKRKGAYTS
ncbi:MAG: GYF domain-containing protein [Flavobacteriales bacterium]|nr:GYF domain-containing protein [Flavobacteriales bacterium]